MRALYKAEWRKYLFEMKVYYPDHMVGAVVTFILFYMLLTLHQGQSGEAYIGFVYWYLLSSVMSEAAVSISAEKQTRVLDQLIIKPYPFEQIILARTLVWLVLNTCKVALVSALLSVFLSVRLDFRVEYLLIFALTVIGVFGFTLLLVALTLKYTKTASFDTILSYILLFFTGALVPPSQMPQWANQTRLDSFYPLRMVLNSQEH